MTEESSIGELLDIVFFYFCCLLEVVVLKTDAVELIRCVAEVYSESVQTSSKSSEFRVALVLPLLRL